MADQGFAAAAQPDAASPPPAPGVGMKQCPSCAEVVQGEAMICRFCRHDFRAPISPAGPPPTAGAPTVPPPITQVPPPPPGAGPTPYAAPAPFAVPGPYAAPTPYTAPVAYSAPVPHAKSNGFALASLILGILWMSGLGSILALVFGYMAKTQIAASRGQQTGSGMATAGIVLGWIGVGLVVLIIIAAASSSSGSGY